MADLKELKFLDLTGLGQYDAKIKTHISDAVSTSLKGVAWSEDGKKMLFYTDYPTEGATPSHEMAMPETDLSGLLEKFEAATAGNVVVVAEDGKTIVDSGIALATVKDTADTAKAKVEALEMLVGTIPEGYEATTIVEYIQEVADNIIANGYDDTELQTKVTNLQAAIDVLNGDSTVEGSVKHTFNVMLVEALAGADADFDTLIEMSNWLSEHADSAAAMNTQIVSNKTAIDALTEYVGTLPEDSVATNVVEYIAEAIAGQDMSIYALAEDLENAITNINKNATAISIVETALAEGGSTYLQIVAAAEKGENAQTAVDNLKAYVGTFTAVNGEETVVAYIDTKVSKVVSDIEARLSAIEAAVATKAEKADLDALTERVTANEGNISTNATNIEALQTTLDNIGAISEEDIDNLFQV